MTALDALIAFAVAAVASLAAVPVVARLAARVGAIDEPDGRRKKQETAVPLGGGLAVAAAAVIGVILAILWGSPRDSAAVADYWGTVIPSAAVLLMVGLLDDAVAWFEERAAASGTAVAASHSSRGGDWARMPLPLPRRDSARKPCRQGASTWMRWNRA